MASNEKYEFELLTPVILDGEESVDKSAHENYLKYKKALEFALNCEEVKNIALSGSYGSGKSSILETFKKETRKKFLHVSLAHFADSAEIAQGRLAESKKNYDEPNAVGNRQLMQELEEDSTPEQIGEKVGIDGERGQIETSANRSLKHPDCTSVASVQRKILNQIIHKIDQDSVVSELVPLHASPDKISQESAMAVLTLSFGALFTIFFGRIFHLSSTMSVIVAVLGLIICVLFAYYYFSKAILWAARRKRKFSFSLGGVSLGVDDSHSNDLAFDRYLSEIVHILNNAKFDGEELKYLVFEDLDRYGDIQIFEEIRGLSRLVRPKFIYMVRDDLFDSLDRVKFFDFVVPVVPVVSVGNSFDQLSRMMEKHGACGVPLPKRKIMRLICFYVHDMRILKEMCNEYRIYAAMWSDSFDGCKLFALIAVKCLFPAEFSSLQLGGGELQEIFSRDSREKLRKGIVKQLNEGVETLERRKKELDDHFLKDKIKLRQKHVLDGGSWISFDETSNMGVDDEWIDLLLEKSEDTVVSISGSSGRMESLSKGMLVERALSSEQYVLEKTQLKDEYLAEKNQVITSIAITKKEIDHLAGANYSELVSRARVEDLDFIDAALVKLIREEGFDRSGRAMRLISTLIKQGFIDDSYRNYISYRYQTDMSENDQLILMKIQERKPVDFNLRIDSPDKVLEELEDRDLRRPESLYPDLVVLIFNRMSPSRKIIVDTIFNYGMYDLLAWLCENTELAGTIVEEICDVRPSFFAKLPIDPFLSKPILREVLTALPKEKLEAVGRSGLARRLSDNPGIAPFDHIDESDDIFEHIEHVGKLMKGLRELGVKISVFPEELYSTLDTRVKYGLFREHLLSVNEDNIIRSLRLVDQVPENEEIPWRSFFSNLMFGKWSGTYSFVSRDMDSLADVIFANCGGSIEDKPHAIYEVINHELTSKKAVDTYISLLTTKVPKLEHIEKKDYWEQLIAGNKVLSTADNILDYFGYVGEIDGALSSFIQRNVAAVSWEPDAGWSKHDDSDAFWEGLLLDRDSKDEDLRIIFGANAYKFDSLQGLDLLSDRLKMLVETDSLCMTKENYERVRLELPGLLQKYVELQTKSFVDIFSDSLVALEELQLFLQSSKISLGSKNGLLKKTDYLVPIKGIENERVLASIIRTHFVDDDLKHLLRNYHSYGTALKRLITEKAKEMARQVLSKGMWVPAEVIEGMYQSDSIDAEQAFVILKNSIAWKRRSQLRKLFLMIGQNSFADVMTYRSWRLIDASQANLLMANELKKWGHIAYTAKKLRKIRVTGLKEK